MSDNKASFLVFGIDFGTTYTGVAWAWSKKPDNINVVAKWDSQLYGNSTNQKVLTAIHYPTLESGGNDFQVRWGYDIPLEATFVLQWFKLLLLNDEDLPAHLRNAEQLTKAREILQLSGKTVEDVIADYLSRLWKHVTMSVTRQLGQNLVDRMPFRVVLTVPAIWKPYAFKKMNDAAIRAGIVTDRSCGPTSLKIVTEPECAARATLADLEERPDVQVGDCITVVDCGGGTADLISYEIEEVEPMKVKECTEGQGGLCGAIFMDHDFEAMLKRIIGLEIWKLAPSNEIKTMMNMYWEVGIKQQFDGKEKDWPVNVPHQMMQALGTGKITLSHGHVFEVFDNVIGQIEHLVDQQVKSVRKKIGKPPKYIILVGGFGRCKYLYERLCTAQGYRSEVLQAEGFAPWTAICRGAVLSSISECVSVTSRVSRANYGIVFSAKFDTNKHIEEDKYFCPRECYEKAKNQMKWFLKRGDNTYEKEPTQVDFYRCFLPTEGWTGVQPMGETIYICEDASPPQRKEVSVRQLCNISFNCPVAFDKLERYENEEGKVVRLFRFQVRMTSYGSAVGFEIRYGRKTIGDQKLDVQFEDYRPAPPVSLSGIDLSTSGLKPSPSLGIERPHSPIVERLRASRPVSRVFTGPPPLPPEKYHSRVLGEMKTGSPPPSLRGKDNIGSRESSGTVSPYRLSSPEKKRQDPGLYPRSMDGEFLAELEGAEPYHPLRPSDSPPRPWLKPKEPESKTARKKESSVSLGLLKDSKPEKGGLFSRLRKH